MKGFPYVLLFVSLSAAAGAPAVLVSDGPHPDAPEGLMEYGQLVGNWHCKNSRPQADGTWKESEAVSTWTWYYILNGHAIQDVWQPPANAEGKVISGTNLRTYDAESGTWNVVWAMINSANIDAFVSSYRNEALHITAVREASAAFGAHMMHITFYNISHNHFDWKYESSGITDGQNWQEVSRLSCNRDNIDGEEAAS